MEGEEVVSGMTNAISTLSTTVSSDALWGVFANAIPYIRSCSACWFPDSI